MSQGMLPNFIIQNCIKNIIIKIKSEVEELNTSVFVLSYDDLHILVYNMKS